MTAALFLGTPDAAVPTLRTLSRLANVIGVVTQPDRARGRSARPEPSPVKRVSEDLGLTVHQPSRMTDLVEMAAQADIGVLVAFGRIVPKRLLEAPRLGMVNVHFSSLPRWRGAAPVQRAILGGDTRTGVSLMQMDEGLDTGPVLAGCQTPIGSNENAGELTDRLAVLGADQLAASFGDLLAGDLEPVAQDGALVTEAPSFSTDDARLDLGAGADSVLRTVRAFSPKPGAWAILDGERFKLLAARQMAASCAAGEIRQVEGVVALGTAGGAVELVEVQPAGKPLMAADAWFNGRRREPARLS
ncbi:MAG: methionyl-tRNA formyltransferase [Acidimicrobiia bacterium]